MSDYLDELDKVMDWAPNHARRLATEAIHDVRALRAETARVCGLIDELHTVMAEALREYGHIVSLSPLTLDRMEAALAHVKDAATIGWVVADGGKERYRTWDGGRPGWTSDISAALYFVRREDAERFCRRDDEAVYIVSAALSRADAARGEGG